MPHTTIWWIRRDLRLTDNQSLTAALQQTEQVIPVFILDPFFEQSSHVGNRRRAFLWQGLRQLDADLRQRGSYLVVRRGQPLAELTKLTAETAATTIFAEEDFSSYARRRDAHIAQHLPLHLTSGLMVHHPLQVMKPNNEPYTVYTPFKKAWLNRPFPTHTTLLPAPHQLVTPHLPTETIPTLPNTTAFVAGEIAGTHQLAQFVTDKSSAVFGYATHRNQLDMDGTAKLSPYLRFGMVSIRQAVVAALAAMEQAVDENGRKSAETWLNELIWREFYLAILYHFPHVLRRSFRPELQNIPWRNNPAEFAAWCAGQTGYPVVDAAMRQLQQTGWMHNRARMIVASFLVKDLLINWQWGERWFMQQLVDGDPAANNGGWQWTAGTGTDAAPYFRVFNPVLQSAKFDPSGAYIRQYVPELAAVPLEYLHAPWEMPLLVQRQAACIIGETYPAPIVDHTTMRQQTLTAYQMSKQFSVASNQHPVTNTQYSAVGLLGTEN